MVLNQEQRQELERLARRKRLARGPAFRARVVLMLAGGALGREIEQGLRTSNQTVCAVRKRFLKGGRNSHFEIGAGSRKGALAGKVEARLG